MSDHLQPGAKVIREAPPRGKTLADAAAKTRRRPRPEPTPPQPPVARERPS